MMVVIDTPALKNYIMMITITVMMIMLIDTMVLDNYVRKLMNMMMMVIGDDDDDDDTVSYRTIGIGESAITHW